MARIDAMQGNMSREKLESHLREWLGRESRLLTGEMHPPAELRRALVSLRLEVVGAAGADGQWRTYPEGVAPRDADIQLYTYVFGEDDERGEGR